MDYLSVEQQHRHVCCDTMLCLRGDTTASQYKTVTYSVPLGLSIGLLLNPSVVIAACMAVPFVQVNQSINVTSVAMKFMENSCKSRPRAGYATKKQLNNTATM
jgi:hypothetical protein